MTLDEAIQHCHEVAKENRKAALEYARAYAWDAAHGCRECANEHEQLADWLAELKQRREDANRQPKTVRHGRWILCKDQYNVDNDNGNYAYYCSCCKHQDVHAESAKVSFCWNCGADMREVGEDAGTD